MRREERVTVQGPVKEQQPDGMSHRGGAGAQILFKTVKKAVMVVFSGVCASISRVFLTFEGVQKDLDFGHVNNKVHQKERGARDNFPDSPPRADSKTAICMVFGSFLGPCRMPPDRLGWAWPSRRAPSWLYCPHPPRPC